MAFQAVSVLHGALKVKTSSILSSAEEADWAENSVVYISQDTHSPRVTF
jgi:hypothetical protein